MPSLMPECQYGACSIVTPACDTIHMSEDLSRGVPSLKRSVSTYVTSMPGDCYVVLYVLF